jgi:hypothetical protein
MKASIDSFNLLSRPVTSFVRFDGGEKRVVKIVRPTAASVYLARRFLGGEESSVESAGKVSLPSLLLRPGSLAQDCDLLIARVSRRVSRMMASRDVIRVPERVRFFKSLPLSDEDRKRIKKAQSDNLRRIRKYGLTFRVSNSQEDFEYFWHSMVLPYAKTRFGDLAESYPYEWALRVFKRGTVMFVYRDGLRVAGTLLDLSDNRVHGVILGVNLEFEDSVAKGALSAIYHFTLEWAESEGFSYVDFGTTRPCLADGVFRTKCRWGAYVVDDERYYDLVFHCRADNPKVYRFFQENPLVLRDGEGLSAIGALPQGDHDFSALKASIGGSLAPGLNRMLLLPDLDSQGESQLRRPFKSSCTSAPIFDSHGAVSAAGPAAL